jgi:hypothetical protein
MTWRDGLLTGLALIQLIRLVWWLVTVAFRVSRGEEHR